MTDHLPPSDSANTPPDQWDAVARFLAGEGSAGETAETRQWLGEHPGDAHVIAALDALLPAASHDAKPVALSNAGTLPFSRPIDVEAALRRVHAKMETAQAPLSLTEGREVRVPRVKTGASRTDWSHKLWAAAAVLVAVAGIARWRGAQEVAPSVARVYSTPVGGRDSITLSDGTKIILGAGSHLTVAANFDAGNRSVQLEGAGQFSVKHDSAHPFSVRAGSALIRDVGTVFTVKSIGPVGVVVSVTEGEVVLSDSGAARQGKSVDLKAGDRGHLRADGSVVSERGTVTPDEAAWVKGRLVYVDAPQAEVQADLRRWFGVELVVTDSTMMNRSITSGGSLSDPIGRFGEKIALMLGGTFRLHGDTLFIDRPGERLKH